MAAQQTQARSTARTRGTVAGVVHAARRNAPARFVRGGLRRHEREEEAKAALEAKQLANAAAKAKANNNARRRSAELNAERLAAGKQLIARRKAEANEEARLLQERGPG